MCINVYNYYILAPACFDAGKIVRCEQTLLGYVFEKFQVFFEKY